MAPSRTGGPTVRDPCAPSARSRSSRASGSSTVHAPSGRRVQLLRPPPASAVPYTGHGWESTMCLAIPAQIVDVVDPAAGLATAEISGVRRTVSTALCPEADVGDWVLIHVGFALQAIDEDEARETLALLKKMAQADEEELR